MGWREESYNHRNITVKQGDFVKSHKKVNPNLLHKGGFGDSFNRLWPGGISKNKANIDEYLCPLGRINDNKLYDILEGNNNIWQSIKLERI